MAPRPPYAQIETLVEFLEQNSGIAKGLLRTSSAKAEIRRKWSNLAITLNALGGAIKDGVGWAKYRSEKKCSLKKHCSDENASVRRTGGGPADNVSLLSALDIRMIEVMGGRQFATGDAGLAVNPFPNSDVVVIPLEREASPLGSPLMLPANNLAVLEVLDEKVINSEERERSPIRIQPPIRPHGRRVPRRVITRSADSDMDRLAEIEGRRIEAEIITARSFENLVSQLDRMAVAQENMASSLSLLASAIQKVAKRLPLNNL